jgi:hypothetical protein
MAEPAALAEALRRDTRPDGDKLAARLTLLKAIDRRVRRRMSGADRIATK